MLILEESAVAPQSNEVFHRLMSGAGARIFVLGRNKYADRVSRAVTVEAFIDDFTKEKMYLERPVIRMTDLPGECIVVSCVMDTLPVTALEKLQSAGVRHIVDYFILSQLAPDVFAPVDFCARNRQDILENATRYEWVYNRLADKISREHFAKVVRFRLNMDLKHMRGFSLAIDRQYFEDFLPLADGDVFVDGGGYDGQTTLQFAAWNKAYRKIYYFEPTPAMMDISRRRLAGLRDVHLIQKGLFSRKDRLRFNAEAGAASSLSATGQTEIEVTYLDDAVQEPITFLKLDIEGAEFEALKGAAVHIKSESPTMAVCIYHDQRDFWRVPLQILETNDCYNLYVRHYSESIRETVMFFVPKGNQQNG
jgi:FkbM family methyltransferase